MVYWVRFGEGPSILLNGVDLCCKEGGNTKRTFEWKENERYYKVES